MGESIVIVGRVAVLVVSLVAFDAAACNQTFGPSNVSAMVAAASVAGVSEICLQNGIYNLSSTLQLADGKRIRGLGASHDDVVIRSSADRVISLHNNTRVTNLRVEGAPGVIPTYGILSYYKSDHIIWSVKVLRTNISIGVNGSSNVKIWDTFMEENGTSNPAAEPNLWINSATDVEVLWGAAIGRGNYPGGDGEIACYNSYNVNIYGTHVIDSGASAIYFVNCDNSSIMNSTLHRPGEWGIDVVSGSDNFVADGNYVYSAQLGGAVFDEAGSICGTFTNNTFLNNVQSSWTVPCNGINIGGNPAGVTMSGNTSSPGPVFCIF